MKFMFIGLRKMKHKHEMHRTSTRPSRAFSVRFIFLSAASIFCNVNNQLAQLTAMIICYSSAVLSLMDIYIFCRFRDSFHIFFNVRASLSFIESFFFFFSLICLHKRVHHFYCGDYLHESLAIFSAIYAVCLV